MAILGSAGNQRRQEKDPVCGRLVVVDLAFGPEKAEAGEVWFCSLGCQAQYQEEHDQEASVGTATPPRSRREEPTGVEA